MTAPEWNLAAPNYDKGPAVDDGNEVTFNRSGPGDVPYPRDEWLGAYQRDVPHYGVENGRQLFTEIPGPPPEGHGGYDIPYNDLITDQSTIGTALFWSDWAGSTALQAGGRGSFTGEHVIIVRIPPGSIQGYQPSDPGMVQANNDRNLPGPWDQQIVLGGGTGGYSLAATSM
jgi:hypothetical protein